MQKANQTEGKITALYERLSNTVLIKHEPAATSWLDKQQAMQAIAALDEQPNFQFKVMINTLLFTGMRGGELCGLQWKDVELKHNGTRTKV